LLQARVDNVDISRGIEEPFTFLPESNLGSRESTFESSTWSPTQSEATNSHLKVFSRPSRLSEPINSKIQGSTTGSSNLQIEMDNIGQSFGIGFSASQLYSGATLSKNKSAATQFVSCKKKTDASMRFTDALKTPAATKTVSGEKAAGIVSKNSHATSSSKPSQSTDSGNPKIQEFIMCSSSFQIKFDNFDHSSETLFSSSKLSSSGALMGSSLFSQSVSFKKKADTMHASKSTASTKTVRGKKAAGSGSKNIPGTSSSKPSLSLDSGSFKIQESIIGSSTFQIKFDNFDHSSETLLSSFKWSSPGTLMSSSLFSQSVSFKKKSDSIHASKPPATAKTVTGKKAVDRSSKSSHATSSSKPSLSLDSGNSKIQESIIIKFDNFDHSSNYLFQVLL